MNRFLAPGKLKHGGNVVGWLNPLHQEHLNLSVACGLAQAVNERETGIWARHAQHVWSHKGAAPVTAIDQPQRGEITQCPAHGDAGYPKTFSQRFLLGQDTACVKKSTRNFFLQYQE